MEDAKGALSMKKVLLLLVIVALSGCGFMEKKAPNEDLKKNMKAEEKKIVVYSSGSAEVTEKVVGKFKIAHPEYQVEIRRADGSEVLNNLEAAKKKPQGDVWLGATPRELMAGKKQELFRAIPTEISNRVKSSYRDPDYFWMAGELFPQVFVTAQATSADQLPWQWEDLALPKYQNQLLMVPPELSFNYRIWLGAVMYRKGYFQLEDAKRWLLGVDANTQRYFTNERELMERISAYPGTLTWLALGDAIRWREKEKFPIKIYLPQGSQPVFFTGTALMKDAPHPDNGELFLRFFYSDEIQGTLLKENYYFSAKETIAPEYRPVWYGEWTISPQDLDWEWIAGLEGKNMTFWEEEILNRGVIPPSKKKSMESAPK